MTTTETRMTMIFNAWARRYAEKPEDFSEILDKHGKPVEDYGECAMRYFCKIAKEMDEAGLLPAPNVENTATMAGEALPSVHGSGSAE